MNPAALVIPVVRWHPADGYRSSEDAAAAALDAGAGGAIIFGGTAEAAAALTARLQDRAGRRLLLAADLERGAGQQFEGLSEFPPPGALASLGDHAAIRAAASVTAQEALEVGVNWVLAPVADLDLEPANPIVQSRAFGSEPLTTSAIVRHWVEACQGAGALACAKHYPGHGRTTGDSHTMLPAVTASADELDRVDLEPFRGALAGGVASVMTAHVAFPALDPTGAPATCSAPIIADLRHRLGFGGLVVSDALIMAGALEGRTESLAAEEALAAGVDIFLYPSDPIGVARHLERRASEDAALAARIEAALLRRVRALEVAGSPGRTADGTQAAAGIRERVLAGGMIRGSRPRLRVPLDLVVVDDDLDGSYPPVSSAGVASQLRHRGIPLAVGGSRVVLAFAEPRAGKGRAGFGARAGAELAEAVSGADLVVLFGHPRLAEQVPGTVPVLGAWHRQVGMQASVAEWLARQCAV